PPVLPPGVEAAVHIESAAPAFAEGQTAAAFGTSDVAVKRFWVLSPTRLLANVSVSESAAPGPLLMSITNGLQTSTTPGALSVQVTGQRTLTLNPSVTNAATPQRGVYPGSSAIVTVANATSLPPVQNLALILNDRPLEIAGVQGNQVLFQIPSDTTLGPGTLRLDANGDRGLPIAFTVEKAPPVIVSVVNSSGEQIDSSTPATLGEILGIKVTGLGDSGSQVAANRVTVDTGGSETQASQVMVQNGSHLVVFLVPKSAPTGQQVPVTVSLDGRASTPVPITIRP
ncbi:MAG: hypothetical protein ACRD7E_30735, partial [Bryobacteraceae bacterium]